MSPTELAAIAARAEAATKEMSEWTSVPGMPGYVPQGAHLGETLISLDDTYENSQADCDFIAHAREDVPSLLKEVERLRKIEKLAEALVDDICEFGTDTPHAWSERFDMLANELVPE